MVQNHYRLIVPKRSKEQVNHAAISNVRKTIVRHRIFFIKSRRDRDLGYYRNLLLNKQEIEVIR